MVVRYNVDTRKDKALSIHAEYGEHEAVQASLRSSLKPRDGMLKQKGLKTRESKGRRGSIVFRSTAIQTFRSKETHDLCLASKRDLYLNIRLPLHSS